MLRVTRHGFIFHPCNQTAWQQANWGWEHAPSLPKLPTVTRSLCGFAHRSEMAGGCPGWTGSQPWAQGQLVMAPCLPVPPLSPDADIDK